MAIAFTAPGNPGLDPGIPAPRVSPDAIWERLDQIPAEAAARPEWIRPAKGQPFRLTESSLRVLLSGVPVEGTAAARSEVPIIHLPMPDGSFARFRFVESPVMAPELAAKFPEIKTYFGAGMDDAAASVRFDLTPAGFHAQILSPHGAAYIEPFSRGDTEHYTSTWKRDYSRSADGFLCVVDQPVGGVTAQSVPQESLRSSGNQLRTYRLAVAATAEYTAFHGGTVSAGMAAIVTAINRVNGVYESELAIRLLLVANNNLIVYTDSGTDPYNNGDGSAMLGQNQSNLDAVIGIANYDIGHVFSTGGGGIASLGTVCSSLKARGVTGLGSPVGDAFYIDYVAHEMGHQFGANHTFNSSSGSCSGNNDSAAAYEPGSGSTIMAYAGICAPDNLQSHSDPYFHWKSYDQIIAYVTTSTGSSCAAVSSTGNNIPSVTAGANYTIPAGTPFTLTASGSDPDGDPLTYCWEDRDLGASQALADSDNGQSPLFRSFPAESNPSRTFPRLTSILNGTSSVGEKLPSTSRTLAFRATVRDNRVGGGGVNNADMQLTVTSNAGPFVITSPNTSVNWSGLQSVTWNAAGTASSPVNALSVNILLSTDGGQTFPFVLAANTPNDGAESVVLPNVSSSTARIKVAAANNLFFDISDVNFTVQPGTPVPLVQIVSMSLSSESCGVGNGAVDPGEVVTFNLALRNNGTSDTTNLVVSLLEQNGVTNLSPAQSYGALLAGGSTVTQAFTFAVGGACGSTVAALFHVQDDPSDLGTLPSSFQMGAMTALARAFTNGSSITIPGSGVSGPGSLYPSSINVSGVAGTISKVTVTLRGLSHPRPDDLDVLLVGPGGRTVLLMSDVGGTFTAINNLNLTFDDAAINSLPDNGTFGSATWKPTNAGTSADVFSGSGTTSPYGASLSAFNGASANGAWSLYVNDDSATGGGAGSLAQGWTLNLTTSALVCCGAASADMVVTTLTPTIATNAGSVVTLRYALTNTGPDPASSVAFADSLPAGLDLLSASSTLGACTNDNGTVRCPLGALLPGAGAVITLQFQAVTNGALTNLGSVTSSTTDPLAGNNTVATILTLNSVPTISPTGNQTMPEDSTLGPLDFTVGDAETSAGSLVVNATSSNPTVINQSGLFLSNNGATRSLLLTPLPNASGVTTITLIVGDSAAQATNQFTVTVQPVNDPPTLTPIANLGVDEGALLSFNAVASDVETAASQLVFSLSAGAPAGAQVSSPFGTFTWTPDETQGPGTNTISIIVTDNGSPSLTATQSFTVVVREVNQAPHLTVAPPATVAEGSLLTLTNTASDPDIPANHIQFSLGAGAPAGAGIDANTGVLTWTPGETSGPSTNAITIVATDDGSPALSTTQTVLVVVTEVNQAPTLDALPQQSVAEETTLTFTNIAHDSDLPANKLTFTLTPDAPAGATINPTNGVVTWTPGEADGPGTNHLHVVVTDDGSPALSATQEVVVVVTEANLPPAFAPLPAQTVVAGATLMFTNLATDPDLPQNTLTFQFGNGNPPGASLDAATGVFSWNPAEADAPGTNQIEMIVTDNGTPALSATQQVVVIVSLAHRPPALQPPEQQTIAEGSQLVFTNTVTDPGAPVAPLLFTLGAGAPQGAALNPTNGILMWTPTEAQGPSTNTLAIIATSEAAPDLSTTQALVIIVTEVNSPPQLTVPASRTVYEGEVISLTATASDPDLPANNLTFTLQGTVPAGAGLNATNGLFTWMPGSGDVGNTNTITVRVRDDGLPPLDDTQSFTIAVAARPVILSLAITNGAATLTWEALPGRTYRVQFNTTLDENSWTNLPGDISATGPTATRTDTLENVTRFYRVLALP